MRHVLGLVIGLAATAALLYGAGWATVEFLKGAQLTAGNPIDDTNVLLGLAALAGVGLVYGLVIAGRISPLAAFVPSIVLLAWTVVYVLDVRRALDLAQTVASDSQYAAGMHALLASGVYAMLGVALFVPVLMPSRWARRDEDLDDGLDEEEKEDSYY
jgi:hypothetical protein